MPFAAPSADGAADRAADWAADRMAEGAAEGVADRVAASALSPSGRGGSHRSLDAAAMAARLLPLAPAMGITRLADQTGLDRIGLPTWAAFRPNSRSLAVHQGKGATAAIARVAALMEAAEAWHAETIAAPLILARAGELGPRAVDPARLPLARLDADPAGTRILWIEGTDLSTGNPRLVPYELVQADFTSGSGVEPLFRATTNGMGAGALSQEAMLHGLCEAIENDAVARWRGQGGPAARAALPIDLAGLPDGSAELRFCRDLLGRFAAARSEVAAWDVTSSAGLAVVLCLAVPRDAGAGGIEPEIGAACHPDPAVALAGALAEAAQARITRISGARDDFPPDSYEPPARAARRQEAQAWLAAAWPPRRSFAQLADRAGSTLAEDLEAALDGLSQAGFGPAVWVDLTRPELGIPVGRMVVPGLVLAEG